MDETQKSSGSHRTELSSAIAGFYRMSISERHDELVDRGWLTREDIALLEDTGGLAAEVADNMIENMVGVLELPLGLGLHFLINDREFVVPMAIEEPSVVAAVSHVAKIVRRSGGFQATCSSSMMIGQIQVLGCPDYDAARQAILEAKDAILWEANAIEPGMLNRGGGAKDVSVRVLDEGPYHEMLIVHLHVDTCDAMGANLVNSMAEGVAAKIESLTGGTVFLRILSNLADQRLVSASCEVRFDDLEWRGFSGEEVAKSIEVASRFAQTDPYRAATHNKGIMNGIGAVCIATGNDWRAIESGAHAYAARSGRYGPLAVWHVTEVGLCGEILLPMAVGTVGGPIRLHPKVQLVHRLLAVDSAQHLAEVMGAVGLAQNMAALKALGTEGIQRGHMSLHARSVAATAGATGDELDYVVGRLIEESEVKVERAQVLLASYRSEREPKT